MARRSKRKAKKLVAATKLDRISKLPDDVLCRILSHLQTKDAVATSTLSKRWEYVWTSTPNLDLSDRLQHCNDYETEIRMFKDYVDNVLFHHGESAIKKCSLSCYSRYASTYLYSWICVVVCCSVQELTLKTLNLESDIKDLPSSLLNCKTLVVLKIEGGFMLNLPNCFCLPNLKTLHLESVIYVDDASAQKLFSGFPCLEELDIKRNGWDGLHSLSISIPSLKRLSIIFSGFSLTSGNGGVIKINTPNLEYLTLGDEISKDYLINPSPSLIEARVYRKCGYGILQGIQNARLLALSGDIMTNLHNIFLDHELPKFEYLSRLELGVGHFIIWNPLPKLLESAPNLEALVFPEGLVVPNNGREFRRFYWTSPETVPECLLFELKTVEIQKFVGVPGEIHLVEFLLESSKVLERMTIYCHDFCKTRKWKLNRNLEAAQNKISNTPKGSESCELEFIE